MTERAVNVVPVRHDDEPIRVLHQRRDAGVQAHRQREMRDIRLQVPRDVVLDGQRVGLAGEWETGQRVVPNRGEQAQRVPPSQPRLANLTAAVEYQEAGARALQVVRRGEPGLAGADDDGVVGVAHGRSPITRAQPSRLRATGSSVPHRYRPWGFSAHHNPGESACGSDVKRKTKCRPPNRHTSVLQDVAVNGGVKDSVASQCTNDDP